MRNLCKRCLYNNTCVIGYMSVPCRKRIGKQKLEYTNYDAIKDMNTLELTSFLDNWQTLLRPSVVTDISTRVWLDKRAADVAEVAW